MRSECRAQRVHDLILLGIGQVREHRERKQPGVGGFALGERFARATVDRVPVDRHVVHLHTDARGAECVVDLPPPRNSNREQVVGVRESVGRCGSTFDREVGKQDAIPGYINKSWFKITKAGIYRGQCAELCGRNHANMFAAVIALPFDRWQQWYDHQAENIQRAKDLAAEPGWKPIPPRRRIGIGAQRRQAIGRPRIGAISTRLASTRDRHPVIGKAPN